MDDVAKKVSGIGRREAIAVLAGLLAAPGVAGAEGLDKAAFLRASSLVTGLDADKLTGMTDALFAAFQAQGAAVLALAELAKQSPPDLAAAIHGTPMEGVAKALAGAWYTGTLGSGPSAKLLSFEDAAAWKAAGFEAVPGMCAGEFGFWADAPAKP